jgi:hypothetical protein
VRKTLLSAGGKRYHFITTSSSRPTHLPISGADAIRVLKRLYTSPRWLQVSLTIDQLTSPSQKSQANLRWRTLANLTSTYPLLLLKL